MHSIRVGGYELLNLVQKHSTGEFSSLPPSLPKLFLTQNCECKLVLSHVAPSIHILSLEFRVERASERRICEKLGEVKEITNAHYEPRSQRAENRKVMIRINNASSFAMTAFTTLAFSQIHPSDSVSSAGKNGQANGNG